jgi:hypothetical protein
MRRFTILGLGIALAISAAACAKKQETAQQQATTVDSLLASNPSEQSTGNLTPQEQYQQPAPQAQTPPAPAPATHSTKKHTAPPAHEASYTSNTTPKHEGVTVPAGTSFKVAVSTGITSATAMPGDSWTGSVKDPVIVGDRVVIPAGATVHGVVSGAKAAEKGSRAVLVLSVRSVEVDGKTHSLSANADSMIASSTRARNVGAVAGGAGAGALIGKAIGGGKGALIGGLIGAGAATGAVAASKGYQVEVKEGAEVTFNVNEAVVMN